MTWRGDDCFTLIAAASLVVSPFAWVSSAGGRRTGRKVGRRECANLECAGQVLIQVLHLKGITDGTSCRTEEKDAVFVTGRAALVSAAPRASQLPVPVSRKTRSKGKTTYYRCPGMEVPAAVMTERCLASAARTYADAAPGLSQRRSRWGQREMLSKCRGVYRSIGVRHWSLGELRAENFGGRAGEAGGAAASKASTVVLGGSARATWPSRWKEGRVKLSEVIGGGEEAGGSDD